MLISHANLILGSLTGNAFHAGAMRRDLLLAMGFTAYIPKPQKDGANQRWACPATNRFHSFPTLVTLENGTILTVTKDDFLVGDSLSNFWTVHHSIFRMSYEFVPTKNVSGDQIKLYEQGWRPCNKIAPSWAKELTKYQTVESLEGESFGEAGDYLSVGIQNEMWIAPHRRMNDYIRVAAVETEHPKFCGFVEDQSQIPHSFYAIGKVLPFVRMTKVYDMAEIEIFSDWQGIFTPLSESTAGLRSVVILMEHPTAMKLFYEDKGYILPIGGWEVST